MAVICCPECGHDEWNGVEQVTAETRLQILDVDGEIELDVSPQTEFIRNAATSVTLAYTCGRDGCDFTVPAHDIESLRR